MISDVDLPINIINSVTTAEFLIVKTIFPTNDVGVANWHEVL